MKSLKELWTELQINAQEVKGALAWLTILAATDIVILNWPTQEEIAPEVWKPWADSLKLNRTYSERKKFKRAYTSRKPDDKGFFFDPMTVSSDSLELLGIKPWIAKRIVKFREKGGRFSSIKDFELIYGIREADKIRLAQFARFSNHPLIHETRRNNVPASEERRGSWPTSGRLITLNQADSSTWERLPDIGPVLASRIVKYRNRLGGFVRREQLLEVYGLDTAVYLKIAPMLEIASTPDQQLDWTTAAQESLAKHPYIGKFLAAKIARFREQNKNVPSRMSIENWHFIDSSRIEKLKPYLSKP